MILIPLNITHQPLTPNLVLMGYTALDQSSRMNHAKILPPDVFEKDAKLAFWRNPKNCAAFGIVAKSNDPE
jgi:hypothetical protein